MRFSRREHTVAPDRNKEYVYFIGALASLLRKLRVGECSKVGEGHVLEFNTINSIHRFFLPFCESVLAVREEPLDHAALALVLPRTSNGKRGFLAIRNLIDTVHVGMIARNERDVGTETDGWERAAFGDWIEDERKVAKRHFEALSAVVSDDHNGPILAFFDVICYSLPIVCERSRKALTLKTERFQYPSRKSTPLYNMSEETKVKAVPLPTIHLTEGHPMADLIDAIPTPPGAGDLVEGTIIAISRGRVYIDLPPFGTGLIYGREYLNAADILRKANPGDTI